MKHGNMDNQPKIEKSKKRTNMSRKKKILSIIEFIILVGIVVGIPLLIYQTNPEIIANFKSVEKFDAWISEYNSIGLIIYIICQVTQIILCFFPGQIIQIAGGYMFGFFKTLLVSVIGALIGTLITFYLAKVLGKNAIRLFCGEEKFEKYVRMMHTKRARVIIFLVYLIPGLPKDMMAYAAGVSDINVTEFTILSLIGRIPAMTVSILFGVCLYSSDYMSAILIAIAMLIIFLICIIKRKSIAEFIDKAELKNKINK